MFGKQLLQNDHYASTEVEEKLESMAAAREDLEKAWIARRMQLDQCLELQLFYRDCEQVIIDCSAFYCVSAIFSYININL